MLNSATPKLKEFGRRLLAHEAASGQPAAAKDSAAFRVCEKLRGSLARLIGTGGFRSLLARALALAAAEVRCLRGLQVKADGALEGLKELEPTLDPRTVAEGEAVLVAQLLALLLTFIGPALTQRLVHDIWPEMENLIFEEEKQYAEK